MDSFFGRNVSYDAVKLPIYDKLQNDALSPFKGKDMAEIFVYASVFGFKSGRREELKKAKPYISAVAFSRYQAAILLTIAIASTRGLDVLFKNEEAAKIIQEYANAGIDVLEAELLGNVYADAITRMSSEMRQLINKRIER